MFSIKFLDEILCDNLEITQELVSFYNEIREAVFKLDTEEKTKTWLQKLQSNLLIQNKNCGKNDAILHHLETNYCNFLNEDLPISNIGKNKLQNQITGIQHLKENLSAELLKNIKHLFGENQFYTLRQSQFINKFWLNFTNDFDIEVVEHETFENYLVIENFNTPLFFKYMIRKIITELQTEDDPTIQRQILIVV